MTEFELKLEIPADRLTAVTAEVREGQALRQRLQARYFDTEDGLLARARIVVRLRKEGRQWVQTAKAPGKAALERLEHNLVLKAPAAGAAPAFDLARHAGTPVGDAIQKALKLKSGDRLPPLVPLYETDVQRITRIVTHGDTAVELALDQGRVVSGTYSQPLCELELELKQGSADDALQLARDWCARHGLWLSVVSKSMKGQRLAARRSFGPAVGAEAPEIRRNADGREIAAAAVRSCLDQILANASDVAGGSQEADHIHQLRVGIRRMRTATRELAMLAEGIDPAWETALVDVFRALGQHRDHSHLAHSQQPQIEGAGGPAIEVEHSASAVLDPGSAVRSPAFQDALLGLLGFVHAGASAPAGPDPDQARKMVRARLQKLYSQALKDGKKFLVLEEEQQHSVRKRLKRLRYLSEFVAPLFSPRKTVAFTTALKLPQEALGLYNDELMALQAYRELALTDPRAWFGVGWLSARRNPNAAVCQQALKEFSKIKPFWN